MYAAAGVEHARNASKRRVHTARDVQSTVERGSGFRMRWRRACTRPVSHLATHADAFFRD